MIALTDSQTIDLMPVVIGFVAAVLIVNLAIIICAVWSAYWSPRARREQARDREDAMVGRLDEIPVPDRWAIPAEWKALR